MKLIQTKRIALITLKAVAIALIFTSCGGENKATSEKESSEEMAAAPTEEMATEEMAADASNSPKVYFESPSMDAVVDTSFVVKMGVEGFEVKPAGEVVPGTGHHHLIIDGSFIPAGETVPKDETHIHYGGGQTEAKLSLSPGKHTITMQFANGVHASYGEELSNTITVEVVPGGEKE